MTPHRHQVLHKKPETVKGWANKLQPKMTKTSTQIAHNTARRHTSLQTARVDGVDGANGVDGVDGVVDGAVGT